jgi:hypothetical protein
MIILYIPVTAAVAVTSLLKILSEVVSDLDNPASRNLWHERKGITHRLPQKIVLENGAIDILNNSVFIMC